MKSATAVVRNKAGLHSRPADLFVRTARLYECAVTVAHSSNSEKEPADAKNIIRVILLNVAPGEEITITADGPDEDAAVQDLVELVESDFSRVNESVRV